MRQIELHSRKYPNLFALVDDNDYTWLNQYRWNPEVKSHRNAIYARGYINGEHIFMHRMLLPDTIQVDHIDGNGLNNQRDNLRKADNSINNMNKEKRRKGTSKYKGVSWHRKTGKWKSSISLNNKELNLGEFITEIEAAKIYDSKATELFGEYAKLNFC